MSCDRKDATEELIDERGEVYGDYETNANLAMDMIDKMQANPGWRELDGPAQYGLLMMTVKMVRIVNGGQVQQDSLADIEAYSRLIAYNTSAAGK